MPTILQSPVPVKTLFREGGEGAMDESGTGSSVAFHVGVGAGGAATDLLPFLEFVGGTPETVTVGGVTTERLVPLSHPYFTNMVAVACRWRRAGKPIDTMPGATDWKVLVDFALVPYQFGGDTPYLTIRRRYGATSITLPGQAFEVAGVALQHDVARNIPEQLFNVTKYNVPTLDDSVFRDLSGKLNIATFLGNPPKTVRFDGVEDEISTNIGMVTNRTVSLSIATRPISWNAILLPNGVWSEPININDGLGIYELDDFDQLLY